jgi:hypothetical protein
MLIFKRKNKNLRQEGINVNLKIENEVTSYLYFTFCPVQRW